MPYVIPAGHGMLVLSIKANAQPNADTIRFGMRYADVTTMDQSDFNRIADVAREALRGNYDTTWTLGPCKQYYTVGSTLKLSYDGTTELGNGSAGNWASDNIAFVCQKHTDILGRSHRGRFFLPGVDEASIDVAGNLTAGTITGVNTRLATLLANINADVDVNEMRLLHLATAPDTNPDIITSMTVAAKVGTMRRRIRR